MTHARMLPSLRRCAACPLQPRPSACSGCGAAQGLAAWAASWRCGRGRGRPACKRRGAVKQQLRRSGRLPCGWHLPAWRPHLAVVVRRKLPDGRPFQWRNLCPPRRLLRHLRHRCSGSQGACDRGHLAVPPPLAADSQARCTPYMRRPASSPRPCLLQCVSQATPPIHTLYPACQSSMSIQHRSYFQPALCSGCSVSMPVLPPLSLPVDLYHLACRTSSLLLQHRLCTRFPNLHSPAHAPAGPCILLSEARNFKQPAVHSCCLPGSSRILSL